MYFEVYNEPVAYKIRTRLHVHSDDYKNKYILLLNLREESVKEKLPQDADENQVLQLEGQEICIFHDVVHYFSRDIYAIARVT